MEYNFYSEFTLILELPLVAGAQHVRESIWQRISRSSRSVCLECVSQWGKMYWCVTSMLPSRLVPGNALNECSCLYFGVRSLCLVSPGSPLILISILALISLNNRLYGNLCCLIPWKCFSALQNVPGSQPVIITFTEPVRKLRHREMKRFVQRAKTCKHTIESIKLH